ncbi:hypothetical protein ACFLYO_11340 [Chloroflexota bacterium]
MTAEQMKRKLTAKELEHQYYNAMYWAGVLIWAGLVFALDSLGSLPQIGAASAWSWVFFGAGLYALVGNYWRTLSPARLDPTMGDYNWAIVLMLFGIGGLIELNITWPVVLILLGGSLLIDTLRPRN